MAKIHNIDPNDTLEARVSEALEARTALGREMMRQFRSALHHRRTEKVGDYTLHELLTECFRARDNQTLCEEQTLKEKYPQWAAMPVSLVAFKVNLLVSLVRESLTDVANAPFIVDPTPKPDLKEKTRERILDEVTEQVKLVSEQTVTLQQQYLAMAAKNGVEPNAAVQAPDFPKLDEAVVEGLLREAKSQMEREVKRYAEEQALRLQKDLYDKTTEGGYRRAVMEFADDFATYPFGCIHGPFPHIVEDSVWRGNKFVTEPRVMWSFERVSPFDLFWTEDCESTQGGTAVFVRKRMGYDYLYNCRKLAKEDEDSGYILEALDDLIRKTKENSIPRHWTEFDAKNPEVSQGLLSWARGQSVEVLIRYGTFTGHELVEMGFTDLDDDLLYETKTVMCGGQVILCQLNNNPGRYKRPVFTASFESRNNSIVGEGLGQKLLSLHKAYRSVIHLAMYNLGLSSEPITEVEVNRILPYMPDEWVDEPVIAPGMVIPADGDRMGNGSRAIKFTQIPNMTDSALRLASYIFDQAHVISNIPAALHGQPVGTGANRTVRGLLTLQGNTLKPIQSALINLDLGIIEPMITLLYTLLVMYDNDFDYTGDSKIIAKGAASMVQREMQKQEAMEALQLVGQLGQAVDGSIMNRTVERLFVLMGILEPGETAVAAPNPLSSVQSDMPAPQETQSTQEQMPPVQ